MVMVPEEFARAFNGSLVVPGDAGYDDVRAVHNGLIDKRPGVIARCHNVADVRDAVELRARHAAWRSRFAAEATTSPDAPSPRAG